MQCQQFEKKMEASRSDSGVTQQKVKERTSATFLIKIKRYEKCKNVPVAENIETPLKRLIKR